MERPQDYVQRRVEERGVRLIRLWSPMFKAN